jgi:glutamate--cysteine ligase
VEYIPLRVEGDLPARPRSTPLEGPGTVEILAGLASREGWLREEGSGGLPRFRIPGRGLLSFEPGGQLEYSTRPLPSLAEVDADLSAVMGPVTRAFLRSGVRLLARGLDPSTPLSRVQLEVEGARYPRQQAHYDRRGPAGRTMMLQTAGVHVNADPGPNPRRSWAVANTIAPHLVAIFANSATRASGPGEDGAGRPGRRSQRAHLWRVLDPTRNRVFPPSPHPEADYLAFARDAHAFLLGPADAPARPFSSWEAEGAGDEAGREHLSTLFPEVRPRGYLEFRGVDALPLAWCIVPAALVTAALHHVETGRAILQTLPAPSRERLVAAGDAGVAHPELGAECAWLFDAVESGLAELPEALVGEGVRERVSAFRSRFLDRGLDPASAPESWLETDLERMGVSAHR